MNKLRIWWLKRRLRRLYRLREIDPNFPKAAA